MYEINIKRFQHNNSIKIMIEIEIPENTELQNLGTEMFASGYNNIDICAYNYAYIQEVDENFNVFLDDLVSTFESLFSFASTLGAFQFVGIIFEKSVVEESTDIVKVSYFFLAIGFLFSILGALTVFVSGLFVRTLRHERKEFALVALNKYSKLFYFGYVALFVNSAAFLVPINILIHELLEIYYAVIVNVFSFLILLFSVIFYGVVIHRKQIFNYNQRIYKRRIYELDNT